MTKYLLAAVLVMAWASASAADPDLQSAIDRVEAAQAAAWNAHDANAYAALFTEDGEVVNVLGWWWRGRTEIRNKLTGAFATVFKDSTLTITEVHVKSLTPKIVVARVRWIMKGAKALPGAPPPEIGIQLQVLTKDSSGHWLISDIQNTNSLPEQRFTDRPAS